jgi:hypothetical protein
MQHEDSDNDRSLSVSLRAQSQSSRAFHEYGVKEVRLLMCTSTNEKCISTYRSGRTVVAIVGVGVGIDESRQSVQYILEYVRDTEGDETSTRIYVT